MNLGQNHTLSLLCLLTTSLSAPGGLLGTPRGLLERRLPLLAEILFLCASVSPRTGADTHLKAVSSQQVTTAQARRGAGGGERWAPHANQVLPAPTHLHPMWGLSSGARPTEKPQVRGCKAREKKTGEQQGGSIIQIGWERQGWLVVLGKWRRGRAQATDRQGPGRGTPAQRAVFESLLGIFQCDDGEDGPPVHAPHAGAVAHKVVVDGGTVGAHLGENRSPR